MKPFKLKATVLCGIMLLCGCTEDMSGTAPANSEIYTAYSLDEKGGSIEGKMIPAEDRVKFEYTPADIGETYHESLSEFLTELDMPEITDLTKRADTLMRLLGTENFRTLTNIQETDAILSLSENDRWFNTGINYESFCGAYLKVFTANAAERLFSANSYFGSYQGELWFVGTSLGGNTYLVREEYELISKTEDEIVFQRTDLSENFELPLNHEPVYDPEKRGEYEAKSYNYKFLKTEQGWRAEEFPVGGLVIGQ